MGPPSTPRAGVRGELGQPWRGVAQPALSARDFRFQKLLASFHETIDDPTGKPRSKCLAMASLESGDHK